MRGSLSNTWRRVIIITPTSDKYIMRNFGIAVVLFLAAAILVSGCITDQGEIDTNLLPGDVAEGIADAAGELGELSGQFIGDETKESGSEGIDVETGGEWIFWAESEIDLSKGGYLYERPNVNGILFKDLKIEIKTENDAPVDLRISTASQLDEYMGNWRNYYEYETSSSFDRNAAGYVGFYGGITDDIIEQHGDEGLIVILEPHAEMPAKGIIRIYYKT